VLLRMHTYSKLISVTLDSTVNVSSKACFSACSFETVARSKQCKNSVRSSLNILCTDTLPGTVYTLCTVYCCCCTQSRARRRAMEEAQLAYLTQQANRWEIQRTRQYVNLISLTLRLEYSSCFFLEYIATDSSTEPICFCFSVLYARCTPVYHVGSSTTYAQLAAFWAL
jgi:hypothetical protein